MTCNSEKSNKFPFEYYRYREEGKLLKLAQITGLPVDKLIGPKKQVNMEAVNRLRERIVWFFDSFLMEPDYQKVRDGKKPADLIVPRFKGFLKE